jgi:hypothetical protein
MLTSTRILVKEPKEKKFIKNITFYTFKKLITQVLREPYYT